MAADRDVALFWEALGGSIVSLAKGTEVVKIRTENLTTGEARKVCDVIMSALEAAFARKE